MRKLGYDSARLDGKVSEDEKFLVAKDAVIASEIVHQYGDGMAYKPADELEKAAWTFDGRWVTVLKHPETRTIMRSSDVYGKLENVRFVKDLLEPKTQRPCRRGIRADIKWYKDRVPAEVQDKIRNGTMRDVSIGFLFDQDDTPGEWNGQKYDYVQRNIFGDHLAAPVESGRCPGPVCGIGFDTFGGDPYSATSALPDAVKGLPEAAQSMWMQVFNAAWKTYSGDEGKCAAAAWAAVENKYMKDKDGKWVAKASDCPLCEEAEKIGLETAMRRLNVAIVAYGGDTLAIMKDEAKPQPTKEKEEEKPLVSEDTAGLIAANKSALDQARIVLSNIFE